MKAKWPRIKPTTFQLQMQWPNHYTNIYPGAQITIANQSRSMLQKTCSTEALQSYTGKLETTNICHDTVINTLTPQIATKYLVHNRLFSCSSFR